MNQTSPVSRSRIAWIAAALWIALLAALIGASVVSGQLSGSTQPLGAGAPGAQSGLVAADPSASPSASTAPGKAEAKPNRGRAPLLGRGGFGGMFGGLGLGGARGAITITAINGTQLSLKTADGWTRTIDAAGATIHDGKQTATVADLAVGDQIAFRQKRNADGTYTVTDITIIQPQVAGTVGSVNGSSFTVKRDDGTTTTVHTDASTTFRMAGAKTATIAAVDPGLWVRATGKRAADGSITATSVAVAPVVVAGQVTAKTGSTITIKPLGGKTTTIQVNGSTTYQTRGKAAASLADVAVDGWIVAQGALNADGSLQATSVRLLPGVKAGGNGLPKGHGFGNGQPKGAPKASPAPTT